MKGLPHQTMAALRQHLMAIMFDSCLNLNIASVSESLSTPSWSSWPVPMHNLTTSSSLKELGHNGVLLHLAVTNTQIHFPTSILSPRVWSISTEAVTMDAFDMLVWRWSI